MIEASEREADLVARARAASAILTLFDTGELPALRKFIFDTRFEMRSVEDSSMLSKLLSRGESTESWVEHSEQGAVLSVTRVNGAMQALLVHKRSLSKAQVQFYSLLATGTIAATYAAIGLDMSTLSAGDEEKSPFE